MTIVGRKSKRDRGQPWTPRDDAVLAEIYTREGLNGAVDALPDRTWRAIYTRAAKLALRSPIVTAAPTPKLDGDRLEEAIRLREEEGWSFARIGRHFGVCETAASNAILMTLGPRRGFKPAQRDANGRLTDEGRERVRLMLRKGLKAVEIQLRLSVSAACVAEQRRRYRRDLKARGKAPLPAPGNGERYSGARVSRDQMREVRELLLQGLGAPRVSERTGVSRTHVLRQRAKLIARLRRKGKCLPGCDAAGKRRRVFDGIASVPEAARQKLRELILARVPVARAAILADVGSSFAYKIRDDLREELAAGGRDLPPIQRLGRKKAGPVDRAAAWLPKGRANLILYRRMLREADGDQAEARRRTVRAIAQRDGQDPALAEQLDRLRRGARIAAKPDLRRPDPAMTLGGVATGAL
jgi:hypothetical protein